MMGKKLLGRFLNEEKGQVLLLTALLMIVILGITAFTTDIGWLQSNKRHLQNTADAAALAGARDLADGKDAASVNASVNNYVIENGVDSNEVKAINIVDGKRVKVELEGSRGLFFARVLGFSSSKVGVRATAEAGPPGGMKGLRPIGLPERIFELEKDGHIYITKDNFGTIGPGNWGWVNLTGGSIFTLEQIGYIINGYNEMVYIGDIIETDTGNNLTTPGHLKNDGLEAALQRFVGPPAITLYIPIISDDFSPGKSTDITIVGFAAINITAFGIDKGGASNFYIEGVIDADAEKFTGGVLDPDAPNFGLMTIGLVE